MRKMIRLGVASAAVLASLPAWGDGVSVEDRLEVRQAEQRPVDTASPSTPQHESATQDRQPRLDEGSAGGEPSNERDDDKRHEQRKTAREEFLNDTWNLP